LLAAIAFGLSWVVRNAAMLFEVLRWIGAAYLIWLGVQAWRHAGETAAAAQPRGHLHVWRGFAVALSNPKSIAFFTAFLPQFVDPALPVEPQLAVMCAVSVVLAAFTDSAWAAAAGLGRTWFMHSWRAKLLGRLSGAALVGGGVWLSLARRPA
jgi:homoserine/homoserine lactone efflux protein